MPLCLSELYFCNFQFQVMCEGKEHAIAIGTMVMEPEEIKNVNKGIGIEVAHYLNDGLWHLKHVKWMFCTEKTLLEFFF